MLASQILSFSVIKLVSLTSPEHRMLWRDFNQIFSYIQFYLPPLFFLKQALVGCLTKGNLPQLLQEYLCISQRDKSLFWSCLKTAFLFSHLFLQMRVNDIFRFLPSDDETRLTKLKKQFCNALYDMLTKHVFCFYLIIALEHRMSNIKRKLYWVITNTLSFWVCI